HPPPPSRRPDRTTLVPDGPKRWLARQMLGTAPGTVAPLDDATRARLAAESKLGEHARDPDADTGSGAFGDAQTAFMFECAIDLSEPRLLDAPLLSWVRAGT
ncbi:MAG: hypothetical protein JST92_16595, partial [Deltaproteobacteria bacterium]|nr:hypothetical protein [Deltaproteobacteria bacterium]